MAVTHKMYGRFYENLMKGDIPDLTASGTTIKCALMYQNATETAFTFNQNHDNWEDVSDFECDDSDYVNEGGSTLGIGGQEILEKDISYSSRVTTFDTVASPKNTVFTTEGTIKATHAVIYYDTGVDPTSKLISCIDFDGEREAVEGEYRITWDDAGIFRVTVAE